MIRVTGSAIESILANHVVATMLAYVTVCVLIEESVVETVNMEVSRA